MSEPSVSEPHGANAPKPGTSTRGSSSRKVRIATALGAAVFIKTIVVATVVSAVSLTSVLGCFPRHGRHGDPEHLRKFVEWRVEKVLKKVDATPEQTESVLTVIDGLITDLTEMREGRNTLHEALMAQLTAETIDRSALEAIRAEKMEEFDVASRRVVDAVASVGEILDQDQRLELMEEAKNHHRWHRGHRGWGRE